MRLFALLAALFCALVFPALGHGGDQTYLSWSLDDQQGNPTVTWEITGSTKWYVGVIQIASRPDVNAKDDFLPQNLVAYDVLTPAQSDGSWQAAFTLGPGTYYGQLTLRYDGECKANCESHSSVRSFTVEPPALAGLEWKVSAKGGKLTASWTKPGGGWFVSMVLVDDDEDFSSPVDAGIWPSEPASTTWRSRKLDPDAYYVRVHARYTGCETCIWISEPKKAEIASTNPPPRFKTATFTLVERDLAALRHTWRVTVTVCDRSPGKLTLQVREETWAADGGSVRAKTSTLRLAPPNGCRTYRVTRRSAWPFASSAFVRVVLRAQDGKGAWSAGQRTAQWFTP